MGNFSSLREILIKRNNGTQTEFVDLNLLERAERYAYLDVEKTFLYIRLAFEELGREMYYDAKDFWREKISGEFRKTLVECHNGLRGYIINEITDKIPGNNDIRVAVLYLKLLNHSCNAESVETACKYLHLYAECCNVVHSSSNDVDTVIDLGDMEHLSLMYELMLRRYKISFRDMPFRIENIPVDEWNFVESLIENVHEQVAERDSDKKALVFKNLYEKNNKNGTTEYAIISLFKRTLKLDHEYRSLQILWETHSRIDNNADFRGINDEHTENILIIRKYPIRPKTLKSLENEPLEFKLRIMVAVVEALKEIHERGICHRNLTSEGILIYNDIQGNEYDVRVAFLSYIYAKIPHKQNIEQVATVYCDVVGNNVIMDYPAAEAFDTNIDTDEIDWFKFDIFHLANVVRDFFLNGNSSEDIIDDLTALVALANDIDPVQRPTLDDIIEQLNECIEKLTEK